jgi:CheY-like chemotaxis protein
MIFSREKTESGIIEVIRRQGYKILVVDDDDKFGKSFCFLLERVFGAHVEHVGSAKRGVEKLRTGNSYDLIFLDIMMPEMTGVEAYHELRMIDDKIRIVIMSAYSDSEEWKKAQDLKDVALLHKPIPEDSLIKILSDSAKI